MPEEIANNASVIDYEVVYATNWERLLDELRCLDWRIHLPVLKHRNLQPIAMR